MFSCTVSSRTLNLQRLRPTERRVTVSGGVCICLGWCDQIGR
jgi:hypothetical protein